MILNLILINLLFISLKMENSENEGKNGEFELTTTNFDHKESFD
jgi:hypothetical protein